MSQPATRLRLPRWTTHPAVGVLALLALAVVLIWRGEPQPSSRPSGTSVAVSGTASADRGSTPALLVLRDGRVQRVAGPRVTPVRLPAGVIPRALLTSRGLSVVLALVDGRQRAYAVTARLIVIDLGFADAVLPAVQGRAAVIVESALVDPGTVPLPSPTATPTGTGSSAGRSSASASASPGEPPLRDYLVRRYDSDGNAIEGASLLPAGYRAAVDTPVGLTAWQPVSRVYDHGVAQESLSAAAVLIRPDGSERALGTVHPLAVSRTELLVWDVANRRFGVLPLRYVTSTATSTASPTSSARSRSASASSSASRSASASPSSTVVAGARWFQPTRGMLLVTGPAAFNADGSAFAVYAQVGSRRRLVVAQLKDLGTDLVEVLVLARPVAKSSAAPSGSSSVISPAPGSASPSATASPSTSTPTVSREGYPISAPLAPLWLGNLVVGVALDATVIGYHPGSNQSSELDLGLSQVSSLALAP